MRLKALINPVSGQSRARRAVRNVVGSLMTGGRLREQDICLTGPDNGVTPPPGFMEECDTLIVAGGDGTLSHVINHLKQRGLERTIAYLPTGTMNDFGSGFHLPRDPEGFLKMLHEPRVIAVDLGLANGRYFHYVVAGGAVSSVSYLTPQWAKNLIGKTAYYMHAAPRFPLLLRRTRIEMNSAKHQGAYDALMFVVTNLPGAGGFERLIPGARWDDGLLHVLIALKRNLPTTMAQLKAVLNGTHLERDDFVSFATRSVTITSPDQDTRLSVDGETGGFTPVTLRAVPAGLRLVVPKE